MGGQKKILSACIFINKTFNDLTNYSIKFKAKGKFFEYNYS